ncbi:hypothetical protein [Adhaeribacter pallidiroseus]|uniref:Uncharacterized protein n=1 Tax=Adhaeribacter pallidiroseus TaxID=2072847 RepID=A0A369QPE2_9BACT|nr:hypothetical protein [Adhaeribacter pallidiroseus]RDC65535.1 hypothetical protein AHMF7616_04165 [Adhaeribacter pallidiroseus]
MKPENENNFHTEWIERYLSEELQGEDLEHFNRRLHTDGAFRQEVAVQRSIIAQTQSIGREDLRQDLKNMHRQFGFNQIEAKTKTTPSYYYAVAATILLLLAFTGIFYFTSRSNQDTPSMAQVQKEELTTQPQSLNIRYQVTGQDPAIGFSGTGADSTTTILLYPAATPTYAFNDTLRLYGNFAPNQLTLQYNQAKEQYTLRIDSLAYLLQRFRPKQALR